MAHTARQKHILFGGAVGGGKSVWLVNDALYYALGWSGIRVGLFRWQFSEFRTTTYKTMEEWLLCYEGLIKKHDKNNHEITLCNSSQIIYGGLKPSESAGGDIMSKIKSLELAAGYIDEVTDVPEKVYNFWSTRMGRSKGISLKTGRLQTPPPRCANSCNPMLGWVKTDWVDTNKPGHVFVQSRLRDNIYADPGYEQELRTEWANNQSWVSQFIEGDWNTVVDFEAIYPADKLANASKRRIKPGDECVFGVDVGEYGDDKSVVAMRKGMKSAIILERQGQSTMKTVNQVAMLADKYHPETINVDAIGVGSGVCDRLIEMGYPAVGFIAGGKASIKGFLNKRAQAYWGLRKLVVDDKVDLPNHSTLINEMGTIRYLRSASGKVIQVESKKVLRKRLGHSPDYADAVVLAYLGLGYDFCAAITVG